MSSSFPRLLVVASWIAAVSVLVCASVSSALGVAAVWSIPVAVGVTVAATIWPEQRIGRALALIGLAWQGALVVAYWPFGSLTGGTLWAWIALLPLQPHALLIAAALAALSVAFLFLFVFPGLGLVNRLNRMAKSLTAGASAESDVARVVVGDPSLDQAWREYVGGLRTAANGIRVSSAPARVAMNLSSCAETRLRMEFFRHLPGVFTGIGIIGTFSGLILGLRAFRVSDDTSVVQSSLNALLHGVWESFLISAIAISLAILVTLAEKTLIASLARRVETVVRLADVAFPPQLGLQAGDESTNEALLAISSALKGLPSAITAATQSLAERVTASNDSSSPAERSVSPSDASHHFADALRPLTERIDFYFNDQLKASATAQQQSTQALRNLASRLEGVSSAIESSGRKTIEVVASRLMDTHLNMASRQQATVEQIADLVTRIEAMCGMLRRGSGDPTFGYGGEDMSVSDVGRLGGLGGDGPRPTRMGDASTDWNLAAGQGAAQADPAYFTAGSDFGMQPPFGGDFGDGRPGLASFGS